MHGTTHEPPRVRFERDECVLLQPLPARRYTSLVLDSLPVAPRATGPPRPLVPLEKRSLTVYAQLARGLA